jgi:hypothetical protein
MDQDDFEQWLTAEGYDVIEVSGEGGYIYWWVGLGQKGDDAWAVLAIQEDADDGTYAELNEMAPECDEDPGMPEPDFVERRVHEFDTFSSKEEAVAAYHEACHRLSLDSPEKLERIRMIQAFAEGEFEDEEEAEEDAAEESGAQAAAPPVQEPTEE